MAAIFNYRKNINMFKINQDNIKAFSISLFSLLNINVDPNTFQHLPPHLIDTLIAAALAIVVPAANKFISALIDKFRSKHNLQKGENAEDNVPHLGPCEPNDSSPNDVEK